MRPWQKGSPSSEDRNHEFQGFDMAYGRLSRLFKSASELRGAALRCATGSGSVCVCTAQEARRLLDPRREGWHGTAHEQLLQDHMKQRHFWPGYRMAPSLRPLCSL